MTAFIILAAGYGSRIGRAGEHLHKALVPLGGRAVITHLLDRAPADARIIVCVGHRGEQVREYLNLAHPQRKISFVKVDLENSPYGIGPGASLLAARAEIGDDNFVVTCCDTTWAPDARLWRNADTSWLGIAAMPAGTHPERWCRVRVNHDNTTATEILDKTSDRVILPVWVGLAHVARSDLDTFWCGIENAATPGGERQLSSGFKRLLDEDLSLEVRHVDWTDVGDEDSYRRAVARVSGYDWSKPGRVTYVLPDEGRVVKFDSDERLTALRNVRGSVLRPIVPPGQVCGRWMFAYDYVPGVNIYDAINHHGFSVVSDLLQWWQENLPRGPVSVVDDTYDFYYGKTLERVARLPAVLQEQARDVVSRIDWQDLASGALGGTPHGDLTFANVIVSRTSGIGHQLTAIDWRESFSVHVQSNDTILYGDLRYDLAKLLTSAVVHWGNAERGDFRPWSHGDVALNLMREEITSMSDVKLRDVEIIAALCLLNSAPLHVAPFDRVLVARGCAWLEEVL